MKREEKYIYIVIIVILLGVIIGGGAYFLTRDNNKNNTVTNNTENNNTDKNDDTVTLQDGIKLVNSKEEDDKIIQEYEIIINGKNKKAEIIYELKQEEDEYSITGYFNGTEIYKKWNYITEGVLANPNEYNEQANVSTINNNFSEKNFSFIKGNDNKNYLAIKTYEDNGEAYGGPSYIIFNDNFINLINSYQNARNNRFEILEKLEELYFENGIKPWYKNNNVCKMYNENEDCQIRTKIEDNKIYYLHYNQDVAEYDFGSVEERIYTINNGILNYEVVNSYKVTEIECPTC